MIYFYPHCTVDMINIDRQLIQILWSHKIAIDFLGKQKKIHFLILFYAILCDQTHGITIFRKKYLNQSYLLNCVHLHKKPCLLGLEIIIN